MLSEAPRASEYSHPIEAAHMLTGCHLDALKFHFEQIVIPSS